MKELAIGLEEGDRAAANDAAARSFEQFFEAHHARLQQALYVVTGNDREAEDLMQDAFLRVWERWDRVEAMDRPDGYLYRTAMNAFRSWLRRTGRGARHLLTVAPSASSDLDVDEQDRVQRALRSLTVRQRAAVVLMDMLEFDSAQAAAMLGVRPSTVRNLAAQARRALETTLGGE
jgi:RNA polymerase sigma-70 factor (ECF subfamily)